jgi:hypothetical protein
MSDTIGEINNPDIFGAGKVISRRQFLEKSAAGAAFTALGIGMAADLFAADNPATDPSTITPFTIDIPQSALDDLKRRLDLTRWPNHQTVSDWSQGVPLEKARALVEYWRTQYDWRRAEKKINGFAPRSMGSEFTLSTCARSTKTRYRSSSPMAGPDRSLSS